MGRAVCEVFARSLVELHLSTTSPSTLNTFCTLGRQILKHVTEEP